MPIEERSADAQLADEDRGWERFANSLRDASEWVKALPSCADPVIRAQGLRYIGRAAIAALNHEVEHADALFPKWFRCIDQVSNWGGPNVDNEYISAAVDPKLQYHVHGDLSNSGGILLQTIRGIWHQPTDFSILDDWTMDDFTLNSDGTIDIYFGGEPRADRNWFQLDPRAERLWLRQYGTQWDVHRTGRFSITRLDDGSQLTPEAPNPVDITRRIERAADWMGSAVRHWPESLENRRTSLSVNSLPTPRGSSQGASSIRYGLTLLDLAVDQGLYIEFEPPEADYWSLQLYDFPWWESLDARDSSTSLNCDQLQVDDDGKVRLVVSETDPGIANWLDSRTAPKALLIYRCVWARTVPETVSAVVDLRDLDQRLPSHYPRVSAEARNEQLRARRRAADRWINGTAY